MLCDKCACIEVRVNKRIAWTVADPENAHRSYHDGGWHHSHHASFNDIVAAAKSGCDVCTAITQEPGIASRIHKDKSWKIQVHFYDATVHIMEDHKPERNRKPEKYYTVEEDYDTEEGPDVDEEADVDYAVDEYTKEKTSAEQHYIGTGSDSEAGSPCGVWFDLCVEDG
jgi:hypothetical protein